MSWQQQSQRRKQLPRNWQTLRQQILKRDNHTCVLCGNHATHVDHIQRGNNHNPNNLRSLCQTCHMKRTGRDGGTTPRKPRPQTTRPPEPHPAWKQSPTHSQH